MSCRESGVQKFVVTQTPVVVLECGTAPHCGTTSSLVHSSTYVPPYVTCISPSGTPALHGIVNGQPVVVARAGEVVPGAVLSTVQPERTKGHLCQE